MKSMRTRALLLAAGAGVLTLGLAGPACAAETSATVTAFTPSSGPTIGAAEVSYSAGAITKVGTATFTANNPTNLTGVVAAVTATGITGDNSATWDPTINVFVSGGMAAGVYSGTITQSVS